MLSSLNLSLRTKQFLIALAIIAVWLCINSAFAVESSNGSVEIAPTATINSLINDFTSKLQGIQSIFQNGARNLFLSLAVIAIVWSYGQLLIKGGELNTIFFELVKTIMTVGLFWWLINDCADLLFTLFKKFGEWGGKQTNFGVHSAADVINQGSSIALNLLSVEGGVFDMAVWVASVIGLVFGIFVFVTCVILGVNIIILEVEFYFFCYIGVFILGTAGSEWTKDSSIAYLKKLIAYSVQYFSTLVVAGIAFSAMENYTEQVNKMTSANDVSGTCLAMLSLLGIFLVISKVQQTIPQALAGLFGGGSTGGYDAAGIGAKTALGTAAAAGGVALKAGGAGLGSFGANFLKGAGKLTSLGANAMANSSNAKVAAAGSAALKAGAVAKKAGHVMGAVSNATGVSATAKSLIKAFSPENKR